METSKGLTEMEILQTTTQKRWTKLFSINFSRLLVKDEIKKGSFQLKFGTNPAIYKSGRGMKGGGGQKHVLTIKDTNAQNDFRINSPAGEYGILSASHTAFANGQGLIHSTSVGPGGQNDGKIRTDKVGLIFYQAGVAVLTASIFAGDSSEDSSVSPGGILNQAVSMSIGGQHGHTTDQRCRWHC